MEDTLPSDAASAVNAGARLSDPVHPFDVPALASYMRREVRPFAGPLSVAQFQGGQSNPTYRVRAGDRHYVLRRKPPGKLLPSAHAIEREYRVMAALAATGVPVPRMLALCEDESVIGTPFYVMEHVAGRVFWDPRLLQIERPARAAYHDEMNRVLAALHTVDHEAAGLAGYGRTGGYIARQVSRWSKQYQAAGVERIPAMDRLIEWLPLHLPPGDETAIVHGDFRLDNAIFHPSEPRVLAILDWELSTLGHPLSDFAYHAMTWRLSPEEFRGLRGADLDALGIPTEAEYVAAYCRRTGRDHIPHWEFYLIFNMFRIAAILHGVLARALQGNAASDDALMTGARARTVASVAWAMAETE